MRTMERGVQGAPASPHKPGTALARARAVELPAVVVALDVARR